MVGEMITRPATATAKKSPATMRATAASESPSRRGRSQFRPDIEGMRALAVGLVIVFHAYHEPVTGGFIGVDIFFVISGFLITTLLLGEHQRTGRVSMAGFYARRVRRILPASTVVVLATLFASYHWLGFITGNLVAGEAKWTAVFAANIHFGLEGTDYFGAQQLPSPLQHMWSLAVEEQFYLVWPVLFLILHVAARGASRRTVLAGALSVIIVCSLLWSVMQTAVNQTWAYFSPLTRAWELAVGALLAVLAPSIAGLRHVWLAPALAFAGLIGIVTAATVFTSETRFPGFAATLPVLAAAALIAAGCADRTTLVGRALSLRPMQWVGARSYSLYLWHWPLLIIPAQYATEDLGAAQATGWVILTVVASAVTYRFVEQPCRRAKLLTSRSGLTLVVGIALAAVTIVAAQWQIASHYGSWNLAQSYSATTPLEGQGEW